MSRPRPRRVFDVPQSAWAFLTQPTDDNFEGQHFDRKEAGRPQGGAPVSKNALDKVRELVIKTVSAFANTNFEGGLLVLGISSSGEVIGIDHLNEDQRNSITNLDTLLRNHAAEVVFHDCQDAHGTSKTLCLICSAYVPDAICETFEANPRAWVRNGHQSVLMNQAVREQIRLRKGILDSDSVPCCPFSSDDVDAEVVKEFRSVFHTESTRDFADERLLYEAGAIVRNNGEAFFTLPGLLFFASNPQRVLSHAFLRLMKFLVPYGQRESRVTPSFDKDFRGPITKQIRDIRTFLRETSFFERFQHRKADGGFSEQMELPTIAVDEAIVNAVAHRDYYTKNPIECEHYTDEFIVKNPGRILQRNVDLPDSFSLSTTTLDSMPRNRKLLEWLRLMKDPGGKAFVQAISEGTKRMKGEMLELSLPAPSFALSQNETILRLESRVEDRRAAFLTSIQVPQTAFMNLYPLAVSKGNSRATSDEMHLRLGEFSKSLRDSLVAHGWYIDRFSFSRVVAHRTGLDLPIPSAVRKTIRFYPAYCIQVHEMFGRACISVDYTCQVLSVLKALQVSQHLGVEELVGRRCVAQLASWRAGKIVAADAEWIMVHLFDNEEERQFQLDRVIPNLSLAQIDTILQAQGISFDLHGTIKKHSLASEPAASRKRAEKIQTTASNIADDIFPVVFGEFQASMVAKAVALSEFETRSESTFHVERLSEPAVEFRGHQKLPDVREGITKFGSYDSAPHTIELVPICLAKQRQEMESLIERLKAGKHKYRGAERTFATRFSYSTIITIDALEGLDREVGRLLSEHPEWCGNEQLNRLFLVHTPEEGYSTDDENSPYYVVKRRLLEAGVPCQMVDTGTLHNPDWKDLNLSLNIIAKCGVTPWVLPDNIPDADFFVGLSYTQSRDGQKILGFANVFNSYGKWEFYAGNTTAFDARERSEHLAALSQSVLERLKRDQALPAGPNLVFHHSVRISKDDYAAILAGMRTISPDASVSFVWVNAYNNFRLFDSRAETDGSIRRGSFVPISRRRVLLSTTGYNAYRKVLGTPRPLEISADHYRPGATTPVECEARTLALQVLNLTKLNWASTDSFTAEPITVKFAGDIAYLTAAFLRQREPFQLHRVLERTPWFV
jgi:predicted HTH transcriptional regulator